MAYKNLNLLFIILILLVNKVVDGQKFIPGPRTGQTATLLGGKIYYIGGVSGDFFYLDENFTWVNLKSQGAKFPVSIFHTSDIGGVNQDSIFIIGGFQLGGNANLVYRFDNKTNVITTPVIQGLIPPKRENMRSVSYQGKIYLLSGRSSNNGVTTFFRRMDILNTVTMNWEVGSYLNGPIPRYYYTATIVNGVIYYIGGVRQYTATTIIYVLMSNIYRYNINANTWTLKIATSAKILPGPRAGHSAVLVNGKICIYGGTFLPKGVPRSMPSTEQIAMLNPITLVWTIPTLQDPNIPSLVLHTATFINNFMLIAFGNITNLSGGPVHNDKFYLFDFGGPNIKWYGFTAQDIGNAKSLQSSPKVSTASGAPSSTAKAEDSPQSSSPSKTIIIGISIGLVSIGLAGILGILFVYNRTKKNQNVPARGESDHPVHPGVPDSQIPPDGEHYPVYQQQFPQFVSQYQHSNYSNYSNSQQDPYYSRTSTLIQSQGYSPRQEFSTLTPPPPPQEGLFKHSPNYFPGSETLPSNYVHGGNPGSETLPSNYVHGGNHGSETPPPPPPKTPQSGYNIHGTDNEVYY